MSRENRFCPKDRDQLARSLPCHGLLGNRGEGNRAGMGCPPGSLSSLAQNHSSEPRRAAGSVPPVSLHIWSREVCHCSHALAPALAPAFSQCGPVASFLLPAPPG